MGPDQSTSIVEEDSKWKPQEVAYASSIINYLTNDSDFYTVGRRNNDIVDLCIACYVTGRDATLTAREIIRKYSPYPSQDHSSLVFKLGMRSSLEERVKRIESYLPNWADSGIFNYLLGDYPDSGEGIEGQKVLGI